MREFAARAGVPRSTRRRLYPCPGGTWLFGLSLLSVLSGCAVRVHDRAPDWVLHDLSGRVQRSADFGGQIVVLDFWATWCAPCRVVSPHVQRIHEQYADQGVTVLAIHYGDQGDPATYMRKDGYTFTVLLDDDLTVARRLGVSKIPTVIIIAPDGRVEHRQTDFGDGDEQVLREVIERLLERHHARAHK